MGRKKILLGDELAWFKENYPNMKNADVAKHAGCSTQTVTRMARELGLEKTEEHKAALEAERLRKVSAWHARTGWPPKGYKIPNANTFKAGYKLREDKGEERYREIVEKRSETYRKIIASERRRMRFGLPQRTELHLTLNGKNNSLLAYKSRLRQKGYVESEKSRRVMFYSEGTKRSARSEAFGAKKWGFCFEEYVKVS